MGAAVAIDAAAARAQACETRLRASALHEASLAERRRADEVVDCLAQTLSRCGTRPLGDRGESFRLELARLRPLVRLARNDLRRWLEQAGLPEQAIGEVTLAVSEACANAVEHPRQVSRHRIVVEARRRGSDLEIRVRDFGVWSEHPHTDQRGRGLSMINELMDSVDLSRAPDGNELVMRRHMERATHLPDSIDRHRS